MEFPEGPHDADAWLITGSKHGAYDPLPFILPLEALIREIYAAKVPMVGICFGHQVIAQALGGTVIKVPAGWEVGRKEYDWGGETVAMIAWHQDQVVAPPYGARVLASHPRCENAALAYGDTVLTVQAHPEFGDEAVVDLANTRGPGVVPDALLQAAKEATGQRLDRHDVAARMADFLKGKVPA